ncbi:unnamed protein product [Symbiodinium microadriaticum]|nr:unnamed protein product [Symbiodinium microadriaticum]
MTEECSQMIVDNISTAWPQVCIPRAGHLKLIDEPHECVREVTRFLTTVEGVRNRYKTSEALIPRQTSHDGPDGSHSPGKLFRRIRAIMPADEDMPSLDLPNVVILPQAVLPDVVVPTESESTVA